MSDFIDTKEQEKLEAKAKRKREKELGDIRKILSMPEGRRFVWRMMSLCGIFHSSWTGEADATLVNEGKRIPGLALLNDVLDASPNAYGQMQREYKGKVESDDDA